MGRASDPAHSGAPDTGAGCIDRYDANSNGDINCTELPSAAKPVTVKNPSYYPYGLVGDGDGDGIGCE
ncbi:MAG TPA: excalibur calcium-binding domain-containing protein [Acidimicrobiales bacterium]|nr:excalibur calcium-binding domain-containing protein [Acidimicrobiales bacterium]